MKDANYFYSMILSILTKTTLTLMKQVNWRLIFRLRNYSGRLGKYGVVSSLAFSGAGDGNRTHVASLEG